MTVAVRDYTDASVMLADYAERRRRLFAKPVEPAPVVRDWLHIATVSGNYPVTMEATIAVVSREFMVSRADILSARRSTRIFIARAVVCWIMRTHSALSLTHIGALLGGRCHTTIMNALEQVSYRIDREPDFAGTLDRLAESIKAGGVQ